MNKLYIFSFLLLLCASSCSEEWLEVDHYDIVDPNSLAEQDADDACNQLLNGVYDTFYGLASAGTQIDWYFKPHIQLGNMPTMDCQAGGWDANWSSFGWLADDGFFIGPWKHSYTAVNRANVFLELLQSMDASDFEGGEEAKKLYEAEARAIRAFNFQFLTINFGPVPMLETGETYANTPDKPRPESTEAAWKLIIDDYVFAESVVDWKPRNDEAGRITKGMIKAYLAKAYMQVGDFENAKTQLQDIVSSDKYTLEPCFGAVFAMNYRFGKESIWEIPYPDFENMGWGANGEDDAYWWPNNNMQWGSLYISHEWVEDMEPGDYRKDYSVMTYGNDNPFFPLPDDHNTFTAGMYVPGEVNLANNRCLKFWQDCDMITGDSEYKIFYRKSAVLMRYAEVLINLAECKFQTGGNGWAELDEVRNRAFGNLEVGLTEFPGSYNADAIVPATRANNAVATVPSAQTVYSAYKSAKGYSAEAWKVALVQERRKEFLAEYSVWYDLTRLGLAEEFLTIEYPLNGRYSKRTAQYDSHFDIFPIPVQEIMTNNGITAADQNTGY